MVGREIYKFKIVDIFVLRGEVLLLIVGEKNNKKGISKNEAVLGMN